MFENQPKALYALALANTGERFGYYTMIAVFSLFLRANFGLSGDTAGLIYGVFLALVYFIGRWYHGRQVWLWKDGDYWYYRHVCGLFILVYPIGWRSNGLCSNVWCFATC